jgi:cytochrome c oxidase subunit 2
MASSPRTGRSSVALFAVAIGAVLLIGAAAVVMISGGDPILAGQRVVESLYPPIAVTEQGAKIRELYTIVFLIAVVIFFVVEGLIIWTVLRYRRKPGDDVLPPQTHGNNVAEIVWTVVPTLIVAFLFVISWQTLNEVDAVSDTPETRIRAVAGQFQWQFDYLDETGEKVLYTQLLPTIQEDGAGGMVVPAGRQIRLTLESPDVIHAFYVPQFLFKRDVVPGRVNAFDFNVDADMAGQVFNGQCAELCGSGHRQMLCCSRSARSRARSSTRGSPTGSPRPAPRHRHRRAANPGRRGRPPVR